MSVNTFAHDPPLPLSIEQIWIYPVKSCAGIRVPRAELWPTGLAWDRHWMLVDARGEFVSQREFACLARVQPRLHLGQLELQAPGMRTLHLALDAAGAPCKVRLWDDTLDAFDMGDAAAQWFTTFALADRPGLATELRLVRFDPDCHRPADVRWTGGYQAPNLFSDGYPLLLLSAAALGELNQRLRLLGQAEVGVERFRPNLVLGQLQAHDEDRLASLHFPTPAAPEPVWLQCAKPCVRCAVVNVDPALGTRSDSALTDLLQGYRQNRRLLGALTFGMNAFVRAGVGAELWQGMGGSARWADW